MLSRLPAMGQGDYLSAFRRLASGQPMGQRGKCRFVRHKCRAGVHVGGLRFLAPREPLSFPLQLQNEVGSHLGRTLHCFIHTAQLSEVRFVTCGLSSTTGKIIGRLQTFADFNTAARGVDQADVRIFQEVHERAVERSSV